MSIKVSCPSCGRKLTAAEQGAGKQVKCPGCGATMILPAPTEPPVDATPAEPVERPVLDGKEKRARAPRPLPLPVVLTAIYVALTAVAVLGTYVVIALEQSIADIGAKRPSQVRSTFGSVASSLSGNPSQQRDSEGKAKELADFFGAAAALFGILVAVLIAFLIRAAVVIGLFSRQRWSYALTLVVFSLDIVLGLVSFGIGIGQKSVFATANGAAGIVVALAVVYYFGVALPKKPFYDSLVG